MVWCPPVYTVPIGLFLIPWSTCIFYSYPASSIVHPVSIFLGLCYNLGYISFLDRGSQRHIWRQGKLSEFRLVNMLPVGLRVKQLELNLVYNRIENRATRYLSDSINVTCKQHGINTRSGVLSLSSVIC